VKGSAVPPDADLARQREVVDAFFAAGRSGDFDALVRVLDPNVVRRSDVVGSREQRGARQVARLALAGGRRAGAMTVLPVIVNGSAGSLVVRDGRPFAVIGFTVSGGKIVEIDLVTNPERLGELGPDIVMRSKGLV
jgi:hypothetical protein